MYMVKLLTENVMQRCFDNLSHGLDIHIVNLRDLTSHSQYRSALVKITYTGHSVYHRF